MDSAALAILLGQGISSAGQIYANQSNIANQRWTNNINWAINAANNATQIDMANTAHQREVADLRAAGLNPILSAGGHGSAVPSLAGGDQRSAHIDNPADGAASSASQLARYMARDYKAQVEQAEEDVKSSHIENMVSEANLTADWYDAQARKERSILDFEAINKAMGQYTATSPYSGNNVTAIKHPEYRDQLVELKREALEAEIVDQSNQNWRNNIKAVGGAVGDVAGVVNSAGGLLHHLKAMKHLEHLSRKLNRSRR